jgi:V/A-type H+-transporting ATPase subunit I
MVLGKPVFLALSRFSWRAVENQNEQNSFGVRLFESGDLVTRLLSNTISYTRILALLMAHWALMLVTYTVAGLIGAASMLALVLSGIVIVGGNVFVIALEGLIVFIHTLRLHFYEWFSKFYSGTGNEFKPFKQSFVYTEVEFERKHA